MTTPPTPAIAPSTTIPRANAPAPIALSAFSASDANCTLNRLSTSSESADPNAPKVISNTRNIIKMKIGIANTGCVTRESIFPVRTACLLVPVTVRHCFVTDLIKL